MFFIILLRRVTVLPGGNDTIIAFKVLFAEEMANLDEGLIHLKQHKLNNNY